jgi:uncharacterized protein YceK
MRSIRSEVLMGLLTTAALSGCASIMSGTSQGVAVDTDPPGATCSVARSGEQLAAVSATPGQVTVSKGFRALDIDCNKDGHLPSKAELSTSFQPWTLGNVLLGGVIGLVIDAATGAMVEYPKSTTVLLVPARFSSTQERDEFFKTKEGAIEDEANKRVAETRITCASSSCEGLVAQIEERKKQRLADLESRRDAVRVVAATVD